MKIIATLLFTVLAVHNVPGKGGASPIDTDRLTHPYDGYDYAQDIIRNPDLYPGASDEILAAMSLEYEADLAELTDALRTGDFVRATGIIMYGQAEEFAIACEVLIALGRAPAGDVARLYRCSQSTLFFYFQRDPRLIAAADEAGYDLPILNYLE